MLSIFINNSQYFTYIRPLDENNPGINSDTILATYMLSIFINIFIKIHTITRPQLGHNIGYIHALNLSTLFFTFGYIVLSKGLDWPDGGWTGF